MLPKTSPDRLKYRNRRRPKCQATTAAGQPCQAPARTDGRCITHTTDPELQAKHASGSAAGGRNRRLVVRLQKELPRDLQIFEAMAEAVEAVLSGAVAPQRVTAAANAAKAAIAALESGKRALAGDQASATLAIQVYQDYRMAILPLKPPDDGEVVGAVSWDEQRRHEDQQRQQAYLPPPAEPALEAGE